MSVSGYEGIAIGYNLATEGNDNLPLNTRLLTHGANNKTILNGNILNGTVGSTTGIRNKPDNVDNLTTPGLGNTSLYVIADTLSGSEGIPG